ncbi:MAG: hypothetical protein ACYS7Y_31200 [Planctomycetota bacterium]|jgi:hypothetical protein
MTLRVTQQFVEFTTTDSEDTDIRLTSQWAEVAASGTDYDPDLRLTSQWVEVAAAGYDYAPKLRVTSQWVEVGVANIHRGFTSLPGTIRSTLAGSTILPGHSATNGGLTPPATDERSAASVLFLTQAADWTGPLPLATALSTLALTDASDYTFGAYGRPADSTISLTQAATANIKMLTASNTLLLSQSAYIPATHELSAESDMDIDGSWSQTTEVSGTLRLDAESTIVLDQDADNQAKSRSVISTINLTQTAVADRVITAASTIVLTQSAQQGFVNLSAESTIVLTQTAQQTAVERSAVSAINLSQTARSNIKMLAAESTIVLTQDDSVLQPYYREATSAISGTEFVYNPGTGQVEEVKWGWDDPANNVATYTLITGERAGSDIIQVQQAATVVFISATAEDLTASSTLALSHDADHGFAETASSTIALTQEATGTLSELSSSTLALDQDVFLEAVFNNATVSALNLSQAVVAAKITGTTRCDYDPSIGSNSNPLAPAPPRPVIPPPAVTPIDRFKLVYPHYGRLAVGDTLQDELVLRAPRFGNREGVQTTRVNRETRNGTLIIYRDPIWPEYYQLTVEFGGLSETQGRGLLTFIESHLGLEIGIQDHEGHYWTGFITNPDEAVVQDGRQRYSASLQIEAQPLVTHDTSLTSHLTVLQSAEAVLN